MNALSTENPEQFVRDPDTTAGRLERLPQAPVGARFVAALDGDKSTTICTACES